MNFSSPGGRGYERRADLEGKHPGRLPEEGSRGKRLEFVGRPRGSRARSPQFLQLWFCTAGDHCSFHLPWAVRGQDKSQNGINT